MDREALRELWEQNQDRPAVIRANREAFVEHLSERTAGHLPNPDASLFEYRQFIEDYKSAVTRQLKPEGGESDTTGADETEA